MAWPFQGSAQGPGRAADPQGLCFAGTVPWETITCHTLVCPQDMATGPPSPPVYTCLSMPECAHLLHTPHIHADACKHTHCTYHMCTVTHVCTLHTPQCTQPHASMYTTHHTCTHHPIALCVAHAPTRTCIHTTFEAPTPCSGTELGGAPGTSWLQETGEQGQAGGSPRRTQWGGLSQLWSREHGVCRATQKQTKQAGQGARALQWEAVGCWLIEGGPGLGQGLQALQQDLPLPSS